MNADNDEILNDAAEIRNILGHPETRDGDFSIRAKADHIRVKWPDDENVNDATNDRIFTLLHDHGYRIDGVSFGSRSNVTVFVPA